MFIPHRSHLGQTCSLSNQFLQWSRTVSVCACRRVHGCVRVCQFFIAIFLQVTNHRAKDEAAAVDRLMRSMRTGNHRCYSKYILFETKRWRKREWERRCVGESIGFAAATIDHRENTFLRCYLSPPPRVTGTPRGAELNAQQSDDAVFTPAWNIYHLLLLPPTVWCGIKEALRQTVCQIWQWINAGDAERLLLCYSKLGAVFPRGEMNSLNEFPQRL